MTLHAFTHDQLTSLFHLSTHDLSRPGEYGIQAIYDHLFDMDDEMAVEVIAILSNLPTA